MADREQVLAELVDERFGPRPLPPARPPAPHRLSAPRDPETEDGATVAVRQAALNEAMDGDAP